MGNRANPQPLTTCKILPPGGWRRRHLEGVLVGPSGWAQAQAQAHPHTRVRTAFYFIAAISRHHPVTEVLPCVLSAGTRSVLGTETSVRPRP